MAGKVPKAPKWTARRPKAGGGFEYTYLPGGAFATKLPRKVGVSRPQRPSATIVKRKFGGKGR